MTPFDLALVPAASWPWGPPGAQLFDVVAVYGLVVLLIGLIVWNAASAPKFADAKEPVSRPTRSAAGADQPFDAAVGAGNPPPARTSSPSPLSQRTAASDGGSVR